MFLLAVHWMLPLASGGLSLVLAHRLLHLRAIHQILLTLEITLLEVLLFYVLHLNAQPCPAGMAQ